MYKHYNLLILSVLLILVANAQQSKQYVPCNEMPGVMQNFYADMNDLSRAYTINSSPERREKFKNLSADYLKIIKDIDFNRLPQPCQADYLLFKRDLNEMQHQADVEQKEYNLLLKWFPFADSIYAIEKRRRKGATFQA